MADERELVGLLHGAARKGVPLEATLRRWSNRDLARLAMERALPHRFGRPIYSPPAKGSPSVGEVRWRVLEAPDGRHRWELRSASPAVGIVVHERVRVDDGERTIRLYDDQAVVSRSFRSGLTRLLDPSWLLTHDLEAVSEGEVNGCPTVTARAVRRPSRSPSGSATDMATERRIVVDLEAGFLHSDTAVIDDEPYETMELEDLQLGVAVDAGSFTIQLPPDMRVLDETSTRQRQRTLRWPLMWIGFSTYGWPRLDPASIQVMGSESGTPSS